MFSKVQKRKYLRYVDSVDDDNNESDSGQGNIDLIITKLQKQVNPGNIHSGNADVILKMCLNNKETTRTTKKDDSIINNISNFLNRNIKEKNEEISQDIGNSVVSVNSIQKGIKISAKPMIDIDISLNDNLKDELDLQEKNSNYILSTANSNNQIISRNKVTEVGETNLNTLSTGFLDNSKYFLNKKTTGMLSNLTKITSLANKKSEDSANNKNIKNEDKNNDKKEEDINKKNDKIQIKPNKKIIPKRNIITNKIINFFKYDFCNKRDWKRRCRNFNIIAFIRNIFISIIIISAIAFYAMIFIIG